MCWHKASRLTWWQLWMFLCNKSHSQSSLTPYCIHTYTIYVVSRVLGLSLTFDFFSFFFKVCLCNKSSFLSKKMLVVKRSHCCDKAVVVSVSDWMTRAPLLWTWTLNFVLFREENFLTYTPMLVSHPLHQLCMTPWNKDMKKRFWQCLFISDFNLQFVHKSHQ